MVTITLIALVVLTAAKAATSAHSPRYTVVQKLARGLAGTPLAPYAFRIEADAWHADVNPYLIASIAGVESTFGTAACGGNAWGIGSCSITFPSFAEGAAYVARMLASAYIAKGLRDVWAIGRTYCPPCGARWGDQVASFMNARFGSPPTVTYPAN